MENPIFNIFFIIIIFAFMLTASNSLQMAHPIKDVL